jgi:very-short-patch-repair endonuclease
VKLTKNTIIRTQLVTPANFAKQKGIGRKIVYYLIIEDKVDYTEIDGVKFVVLTEKSRNYKKKFNR